MTKTFADEAVDIKHGDKEKLAYLIEVFKDTHLFSDSAELRDPRAGIKLHEKELHCLADDVKEVFTHSAVCSFKLSIVGFLSQAILSNF